MFTDTATEHPYAPELSQTKTTIDSPTSMNATRAKGRRADSPLESELPLQQNVALLQAARERLVLTQAYPVPSPIKDDELVVEIRAIGLNPVDWKSMYASAASIGVAYVAAALALGVSLGLKLSGIPGQDDVDLWEAVRQLPSGAVPVDVVEECLSGIESAERPQPGDWIAIYGGASTSALFISEIARLAGLRVILLADGVKHGGRLIDREGSVLVDSHDHIRAIEIVRSITKGKLRFAVDTVGKETAGYLVQMLQADAQGGKRAHLVGLAGIPKETTGEVVFHSVPIKLFHEVPCIGLALMNWLERALETEAVALPEVEHMEGGLSVLNPALDRMRRGEISGRRLVVSL
ncbi:unnamed protein product [Aureobasidium vineae]|uniref:GroES-like protein n=1 Tax=Aureobasidium vineae TaxID=2773715 RepID=A0A9N8JB45_9PEZI|nr:unnamed protein product [Aureobasidium vineae]